jgi:4-hydroxybenzoate polyprenyltransferase
MKAFTAFFKLIRWPNLVFIALTQCLFFFYIFFSINDNSFSQKFYTNFYFLVLASVLIAAAGYIINDYFDVKIDAINKPQKVIIGKIIKRRWAIILHWIFSGIGVLISLYISYTNKNWIIGIGNLACVILLWFYSTTFKRKLLSGNILVALLSAYTILVVYVYTGPSFFTTINWAITNNIFNEKLLFKYALFYASFAFVTTLIREAVKDLEDIEGDRKYGCNTMPIAWGIPATKIFIAIWIVVVTVALFILQLYAWLSGKWLTAIYYLLLLIIPLGSLFFSFKKATLATDYKKLSFLIKLIILAGILSMCLVKINL